jgi:hypothetical protein
MNLWITLANHGRFFIACRHLVDTGLAAAGGGEGAVSMKACYGGKQCKT